MRMTKLGHACVRVESGDAVVVLDPGAFTEEADATDGATAVLVTHEHPDHWSLEHLRRTDAPVVTIRAVADAIAQADPGLAARVRVVRPGDRLDDLGLPIEVVGEKHAVIHPDMPHFDNSGFLLDVEGTTVFHPGDALTVPERDVDLMLLPVSAPWLKFEELVDHARAVGAPRNVAIHDAIYSETGHAVLARQLPGLLGDGATYTRLPSGSEV
jgi:L-ascorbate metabolism protein UlaG (beta-lactamase superfamily)